MKATAAVIVIGWGVLLLTPGALAFGIVALGERVDAPATPFYEPVVALAQPFIAPATDATASTTSLLPVAIDWSTSEPEPAPPAEPQSPSEPRPDDDAAPHNSGEPRRQYSPIPARLPVRAAEELPPTLSDALRGILAELKHGAREAWAELLGEDANRENAPAAGDGARTQSATAAPARDVDVASRAVEALGGGAVVLTAAAGVAVGWALGLPAAIAAKLKKLMVVAGFTRLTHAALLDHEERERLYAAVRDRPGIALADLVALAQAARNTVTYHMRVLEREGLVVSRREGRTRLYFPTGAGGAAREHAAAIAALAHETTRAVAQRVAASPGLDQNGLCRSLGLTPSLAHWHVGRLERSGVIRKERDGRHVRYYPGEVWPAVSAGF